MDSEQKEFFTIMAVSGIFFVSFAMYPFTTYITDMTAIVSYSYGMFFAGAGYALVRKYKKSRVKNK